MRKNNLLLAAGGALLVLLAAWYFLTPTISVTSEPSNAQVRIDGRLVGRTPIVVSGPGLGRHKLEVSHAPFAPFTEQFELAIGSRLERQVVLQPGEGALTALSNPIGAWVEVDGKRMQGVTPLALTLSSGEHTILMGKNERRSHSRVIRLKHGEETTLNLDLQMDPHGTLRFDLSPGDSRIEFVGSVQRYQPGMRLPIGEYAVRASRPGYVEQNFRFTVRYGDNQRPISLQRQFAGLQVRTDPGDALVRVMYDEAGLEKTSRYTPGMQVPLGKVQVRVSALGRRSQVRTLTIAADGAKLEFDLKPYDVRAGEEFTDALVDGGLAPTMVVVPPGRFQLGKQGGAPSETPVQEVTLPEPFAVAKYEVTVAQYKAYAKAEGLVLNEKISALSDNLPVVYVNHAQASAYANWLSEQTQRSYRLLTESEWEYVARAGATQDYSFGQNPDDICAHGNVSDLAARQVYRSWTVTQCDDGYVRLAPVGQFLANPFGLHDLYGNAAEWVQECNMPSYSNSTGIGSEPMLGNYCDVHGYRGGSWDGTAVEATSFYRNASMAASDDRGIRVMQEL